MNLGETEQNYHECDENHIENLARIMKSSKYSSPSLSEATRRHKLKTPVRSQLVMALRVENKNLCTGKIARALMDTKAERTQRWIEGN